MELTKKKTQKDFCVFTRNHPSSKKIYCDISIVWNHPVLYMVSEKNFSDTNEIQICWVELQRYSVSELLIVCVHREV